jgi:hypothetical protein
LNCFLTVFFSGNAAQMVAVVLFRSEEETGASKVRARMKFDFDALAVTNNKQGKVLSLSLELLSYL